MQPIAPFGPLVQLSLWTGNALALRKGDCPVWSGRRRKRNTDVGLGELADIGVLRKREGRLLRFPGVPAGA